MDNLKSILELGFRLLKFFEFDQLTILTDRGHADAGARSHRQPVPKGAVTGAR